MSEVKVWWVDLDESPEEDDISVGTLLREYPRQGPLNWQESLFPVVKKSNYDDLKSKLAQYESGDLPTWKSEHDILKEVCDSLDKSNQELQKDLEIVRDSHRRQCQLNDALYLKQIQLENQNEDLKARLEKAVEALKEIVSYKWCPACKNEESVGIAEEVLSELGVE